MKTTSISKSEKIFNFVFIFLTSLGLGYALVNQFILNKPKTEFLVVMILLICYFGSFLATKKNREIISNEFQTSNQSSIKITNLNQSTK